VSGDWTGGNRVDLLENGEGFYPAVFDAIRGARTEVIIETFILFEDKVGLALRDVLRDAARRGVRVDLTIDDWGSPELSRGFVGALTDAGVGLHVFSPKPRLLGLRTNVIRRMHRKLVVVDGRCAFVGGINYSADHLADFGPEAKTDYAVRIEGPVVDEIHRFAREAIAPVRRGWWPTRRAPAATPWRASGAERGGARVRFVTRDNRDHPNDIERHYRIAIRSARREITIANAYFFPGYLLLRGLRRAARRSVRVRLLLQGQPDMAIVTFAARLLYAYLLRAGVEIHEYCERPFHGKVAVVDDAWATVGSSNLDPLSLTMNLEANVVILDRDFNARLRASLERLMERHCKAVAPHDSARDGRARAMMTGAILAVLRRLPDWGWRGFRRTGRGSGPEADFRVAPPAGLRLAATIAERPGRGRRLLRRGLIAVFPAPVAALLAHRAVHDLAPLAVAAVAWPLCSRRRRRRARRRPARSVVEGQRDAERRQAPARRAQVELPVEEEGQRAIARERKLDAHLHRAPRPRGRPAVPEELREQVGRRGRRDRPGGQR
jgi:cardiolipin synthase